MTALDATVAASRTSPASVRPGERLVPLTPVARGEGSGRRVPGNSRRPAGDARPRHRDASRSTPVFGADVGIASQVDVTRPCRACSIAARFTHGCVPRARSEPSLTGYAPKTSVHGSSPGTIGRTVSPNVAFVSGSWTHWLSWFAFSNDWPRAAASSPKAVPQRMLPSATGVPKRGERHRRAASPGGCPSSPGAGRAAARRAARSPRARTAARGPARPGSVSGSAATRRHSSANASGDPGAGLPSDGTSGTPVSVTSDPSTVSSIVPMTPPGSDGVAGEVRLPVEQARGPSPT